MMTHGPPRYILDRTEDDVAAGCEHLLRAVCRARPRLHCFGHVHNGWGAMKGSWDTSTKLEAGKEDDCFDVSDRNPLFVAQNSSRKLGKAAVTAEGMGHGEHTLFVNAAIEDKERTNAPWVVTLDLPVKGETCSIVERSVKGAMEVKGLTEQCDDGVTEVDSLRRTPSPTLTKLKIPRVRREENGAPVAKKGRWI